MPVTQRDIADEVGVSVNTVSVVLRDAHAPLIGEKTRQRILETARKLGYRPNPHARALAGAQAPLVKLSFEPTNDYISNRKATVLINALRRLERDVTIADDIPRDEPDAAVEMLAWGSPEAVVFLHLASPVDVIVRLVEGLQEEGIYTLIADLYEELGEDVPCDAVRLDRYGGARRAVDHLIELGHRQIGLITCDMYRGRQKAYNDALQEAGVPERYIAHIDMPRSVTHDPQVDFTRQAMEQTTDLLSENPEITALVCPSDMAALGSINACRTIGLKVPGDISLIGFHNDPWTQFINVPLTTMAEPVEEICTMCFDLISARFHDDEGPWKRKTANYRLVERASTAPPGGAR